jgi:integrase
MLTSKGLAALPQGAWATDPGPRRAGVLQARKLKNGAIAYYFRYTSSTGHRERVPIGLDIPLKQARSRAADLSARYQAGSVDLKEALAAEAQERDRRANAAAADAKAKASATLGALLTAYVAQMQRDGKASARAVSNAFDRHIKVRWPDLWATPAQDIETNDFVVVLNGLIEDQKRREAAKLRSYLIAAYNEAARARHDPAVSEDLRRLSITANPARDLAAIRGASVPRDRALSVSELQAYWRRAKRLKGVPGAVLRFHVLTGGQRIEQLCRLKVDDIQSDDRTMRMSDKKGRRHVPRSYRTPLLDAAFSAIEVMNPQLGPYVFTCSNGIRPASYGYLSDHMKMILKDMAEAGELPGGPATPGDLRRTIETRLAALSISSDVRGQLQSHGLGGVQSRHYDRHDYLDEKRDALEKLLALMEGKSKQPRSQRRH